MKWDRLLPVSVHSVYEHYHWWTIDVRTVPLWVNHMFSWVTKYNRDKSDMPEGFFNSKLNTRQKSLNDKYFTFILTLGIKNHFELITTLLLTRGLMMLINVSSSCHLKRTNLITFLYRGHHRLLAVTEWLGSCEFTALYCKCIVHTEMR